jgi:hypothetical protein
MPTAHAVASELRRIADLFDKSPDSEIEKPILNFFHYTRKDHFIELVKVFPHPIEKGDGYGHDEITLTHRAGALTVYASIEKSAVCTLVEPARPARYECTPLLSLEEEEALGAF